MKRVVGLSLALLGLAVLAALLGQGAWAEGTSAPRRALPAPEDQPGVDWFCPSLALDSTGAAHISYWAKNVGNDLRYASWDDDLGEWGSEVVDDSPEVGQYTSLAFDSQDRPRISYWDQANADLKYAAWTGTAWNIQTVDSTGEVGSEYSSLQLDAGDRPHISYYDATNGDLKYAYRLPGQEAWGTSVVDTGDAGANVGTYSSLRLDSAGNPHISYYDELNRNLKYASGQWNGTGWVWQTETVDNYGFVGRYTSLALDADDHPHISYYYQPESQAEVLPGDLKYAYWDPVISGWQIEIADDGGAAGDAGRFSSLQLDSAGNPHIAYHNDTSGRVTYAHLDGGTWLTETVDSTVLALGAVSLQLDEADRPRVAYGEKTNSDIRYAYWHPSLHKWMIQTVYTEEEAGVGYYTSLELDSGLVPSIAYYDKGERDLKYAQRYWDGSSWVWGIQVLEASGRTGRYCSLELSAEDLPRIGYLDSLDLEQKLASWDGAQWLFDVVTNSEGMGRYSSMALDSAGNAHFASYGQVIRGLAYAYWDGIQWQSRAVDTVGDCGWSTAIAVDAALHPHISYTDAASDTLRYAHWDGTAWLTTTVAPIGPETGAHRMGTSIALDAEGRPHISYFDSTGGDLMYASWDGANWSTEMVDSGKNVGSRSSLRFDGDGYPRIGYYDEGLGSLKYARWDGAGWLIETVKSGGEAGWYLSLALEDTPPYNPHLAYMARVCGGLMYSYWDGGQWATEVVESPLATPVQILSVYSDEPVHAGETMHFGADVTGTLPIGYAWDFGGSGKRGGTDAEPTFTYNRPGTYTVTLLANNGCIYTDTATIDVRVFYGVHLPLAMRNR